MHTHLSFSTLPLWTGALLTDWAYARSEHVQWSNFASWLIVGALVMTAVALVWAVVAAAARRLRGPRVLPYLVVLASSLVAGIVNALVHARDAYAILPMALVLSVFVLILAIAATALGWAARRTGSVA